MKFMRHIVRPVSVFVSTAILSMTMYMPAVQAAMVTTDQLMGAVETSTAHIQLKAALMRAEVQQALIEQGVNPLDVQARVDALSHDEAAQLASRIEQLPAGGDGLGLLVLVFLILVVTDILCLTNIFSFTVKQCR